MDHSLYLPQADRTRFFDGLLRSVGLASRTEPNTYVRLFLDIFVLGAPHMSLRDIEQAIYHLGIVLNTIPSDPNPFEIPLDILAATLMVFRMVAPDTYQQFTRGETSDFDALNALGALIKHADDYWWQNPNYSYLRVWNKMEAILIGWGRHISSSWQAETPLLQHRRSEAEDSDNTYAATVVRQAQAVVSNSQYSRVLSLIDMIAYDPPSQTRAAFPM